MIPRLHEAVLQAAESAVREIVGNSTMDSVLYEQRDAIGRTGQPVGHQHRVLGGHEHAQPESGGHLAVGQVVHDRERIGGQRDAGGVGGKHGRLGAGAVQLPTLPNARHRWRW